MNRKSFIKKILGLMALPFAPFVKAKSKKQKGHGLAVGDTVTFGSETHLVIEGNMEMGSYRVGDGTILIEIE